MTSSEEVTANSHRRHLWGWLCYAFASEVFAVCSLGIFLPLCLEQFARDNGYLLPDRTVRCPTSIGSPTPTNTDASTFEGRCVVKLGWLWIDSASFSLYVFSASVAIQALTVISMGNVADHPPHRKLILLGFAVTGAISAILFLPLTSTSPLWPLSALLAILSNVGFGASMVALNSYLPGLARSSPEVVAAKEELERLQSDTGNGAAYKEAQQAFNAVVSRSTAQTSSKGIAIGYTGGITLLLIALVPLTMMHGSTFSLRLGIAMSGIWWLLFTIPAAAWLPGGFASLVRFTAKDVQLGREEEREGLLPSESSVGNALIAAEQPWSLWVAIKNSWRGLAAMLRPSEARRLRNTFWYLAAWFLLSDGFTSITSTAMLFGKTTLHIPSTHLVFMGVLAPASGIGGSLLWPRLQKRMGWSNIRTLVMLVAAAAMVPLYGCLGALIWLKNAPWGGLRAPWEMWIAVIYFGSIYGAFQGYARSVFAEMIPPGEEARWYGLYSITDKSSSFLGPLIVGLIADATGNIRYGFFFLVFMILLPVPILVFGVDVDQGREDAVRYAAQSEAPM